MNLQVKTDRPSARRFLLWWAFWSSVYLGPGLGAEEKAAASRPPPTTADVLSIFNRRCVECHGISKQSNQLRLDSLDGVFRGGRSGPAVFSGRSEESLLYQKVIPGAKKHMPPKGDPLGEEEIATIRLWIDSGAKAAASASAGPPPSAEEVSVSLKPLPEGFLPIFCLAGDPAGSRIAVGRGNLVEVIGVPEGSDDKKPKAEVKLAASLRGHSDLVQSLAFSPDGKRLASGEFRVARVWSGETFDLLKTLSPHADRVLALAFSPDSKRLAAGGGVPTESGEVKLWDLETGNVIWSATPHSDTVLALAFSPDGNTVITGAADRTTYLLDAKTGHPIRRLEGHTHHVLAVAMSADGKRLATAGADKVVRLWDLEGGEPRGCRGHEAAVTSVQFIREGKQLVSTSGDATVRFWNVGNGNQEGSLGEAKGYLQAGSVFAGGKRYAAAEEDGAVRIYDLEKKKLLFSIESQPWKASR